MKYVIGVNPLKVKSLETIKTLGIPSAQMGETIITFDTGAAFVLAAGLLRQERVEFTASSIPHSGKA